MDDHTNDVTGLSVPYPSSWTWANMIKVTDDNCPQRLGKPPTVSIIIVTYNGAGMLRRCLASLTSTIYSPFEIIVVDNGSNDKTLSVIQDLQRVDPRIRVIRNSENVGFALGNNIGALQATGEFLVFLNNDTTVDPFWLDELVTAVDSSGTIGAAQAKLLIMNKPGIVDSMGSYLTTYGMLHSPGMFEKDPGKFGRQSEILVAKGAAMLVRKDLFFRIGAFDPRFFCYHEELDLCWRIWLTGHSVIVVPTSIVFHAFGGTTRHVPYRDALFFYHGHKNYINTLFKNLSTVHFLRYAIPYVLLFLGFAVYSSPRKRPALYHVVRAWFWNGSNLKPTLRQRMVVQRLLRRVPDGELLAKLTRKIGLVQLTHANAFSGPRKLAEIYESQQ